MSRPQFTTQLLAVAKSAARRILIDKSLADDAVQLAAMSVIRGGYPTPYIVKKARFVAMTLNDKHCRYTEVLSDVADCTPDSTDELRVRIRESVRSDREQVALLYRLDGYSYDEIAEKLEISRRTASECCKRGGEALAADV